MRDMFDDFMRELAERQRRLERGQAKEQTDPKAGEPAPADAESGEPVPADAERPRADAGDETPPADQDADQDGAAAGDDTPAPGDADDSEPGKEPVPFRRRDRRSRRGRDDRSRAPQGVFGGPGHGSGAGGGGGGRSGGGSGGGPGGPDDGSRRSRRQRIAAAGPQVLLIIIGVILLAAVLLVGSGVDLATDAIWFKSVGFDGVFWTRLGGQAGLFALGLVVALIFFFANLWLAGRLAPPPGTGGDRIRGWATRVAEAARGSGDPFTMRFNDYRRPPFGRGPGEEPPTPARPAVPAFDFDDLPDLSPLASVVLIILAIVVALGTAATLAGNWQTIALWANRVPYAPTGTPVTDPVFHRDISFYLFDLPLLTLVRGVISSSLLVAFGLSLARYLISALRGGGFPVPVRVHLAILGGAFLLTVAAGYQLDKLALVYGDHGFVTGVSYADQAARFFANDALTLVAGIVALLFVFAAFSKYIWPAGAGIVVWIGLSVLLGGLYPAAIQQFTVKPNEFAQEQTYIGNNIAMTNTAYNLGTWKPVTYKGDQALTAQTVKDEAGTFANARLWDVRPLKTTLDQIQTVRQYYDFVDIDTDRYTINGQEQQVMLGARELAADKISSGQSSWVNQRIVFTHGFGAAMVPVNKVDSQGLPEMIIRDMPPVSTAGAPAVKEPRIYFGERANDWVVVGAQQAEFDYPVGSSDTTTTAAQPETKWAGTTGIKIDSVLTRLLFAARFRDLNLLISDQVTAGSQLLMNRSLSERLQAIAPFLVYDKDPYLVIDGDGRLKYVQDAYTVSDRFPNAQAVDTSALGNASGFQGQSINYVRNSVKVVMDAYDGSMTFYVADSSDPLIRAWQGVFPGMFHSLDEMPAALRAHLRVPEELFNIQTLVYARYHVLDASSFYNSNDLWTIPQSTTTANANGQPLESYYVTMRMPGEVAPEFLLLQPMVPQARPNMIAWVAARSDGANYGSVRVYQFPRDSSVYGPGQIQSKILQNPSISAQVSLWNQAGSQVVYGNLIVVPVQDSIVYLEPIYLQATGSPIPEFTKIVVATPTAVAWGDTLAQALNAVLAGGGGTGVVTPTPGPGASPTPTAAPGATSGPLPADVPALVQYANQHYELAQAALRNGDFATYGTEINMVKAALAQLNVLTATPAPTVVPAPTAAPVPSATPAP